MSKEERYKMALEAIVSAYQAKKWNEDYSLIFLNIAKTALAPTENA